MATRTRASSRRRASANNSVIDLTCDPDSDSDGEVLIIGTTPAPVAVPLAEPDSPVDIVGMVVDVTSARARPPTPPPPPPYEARPPLLPGSTDYPRNSTETWLETELSDLSIDVDILQNRLREGAARVQLRSALERELRDMRQSHAVLSDGVAQLTAGRRLRFEALLRPLSAKLDEAQRLLSEPPQRHAPPDGPWQHRDTSGPMRTRRSVHLDDPESPPPSPPMSINNQLVAPTVFIHEAPASSSVPISPLVAPTVSTARRAPEVPPRPMPSAWAALHSAAAAAGTTRGTPAAPRAAPVAPAATPADKAPSSPEAPGGLHCPVCWESVSNLKEQQTGFLVTRCGHWFCSPCLKNAVSLRRECPICRARLTGRPPFRPLFL